MVLLLVNIKTTAICRTINLKPLITKFMISFNSHFYELVQVLKKIN